MKHEPIKPNEQAKQAVLGQVRKELPLKQSALKEIGNALHLISKNIYLF